MFDAIVKFISETGFVLLPSHPQNLIMIGVGLALITLGIRKNYEPLLLIPIGFGMIMGNIPEAGTSPDDAHGVIHFLYFGVRHEIYPALIFLGLGAMTDFSAMLSQPRLILLGAAAQAGIFATYWGALQLGFTPQEAGAIGIIGGADGPTTIFITTQLAEHLLPAVAVAAYSYMALVPVIQPPIVRLLTTREERLIKMDPPREVSQREKMLFPIIGFLVCTAVAPKATTLLGMLFFGNLLKESGVTDRLANTAKNAFIDSVTIILGICVGAGASADRFLRTESLQIFALGAGRVLHCHGNRSHLRQDHESIFESTHQSHHWRSRCLGGTHGGPCRANNRPGGRPDQLPHYARHGPQRSRRNRFGGGGRRSTFHSGLIRNGPEETAVATFDEIYKQWGASVLSPAKAKSAANAGSEFRTTTSGIRDRTGSTARSSRSDYPHEQLGMPGEYPLHARRSSRRCTAAVFWTMRQYAGFGTRPKSPTNATAIYSISRHHRSERRL